MTTLHRLTVQHPSALLAFLFASFPETEKTKVRQWLKHGAVEVNGRSVTRATHALQTGDAISIRAKNDVPATDLLPAGMRVLFEDPSLIVVEKPENMLSVASATERRKTVYALLTNYLRRGNPRGHERVWIVHRLDRESSGLMVFAKSEDAKRELQASWPSVAKRYLAVVEGAPPAQQGVLRSHLDESGPFKVYSAARSERTRSAITRYRVRKRVATRTLLELTLETGRRNQIRVHLADAGCPIVGDRKYDARTDPARRLALHATVLQFQHPLTREPLDFESPLPHSLAGLL